ncbi:MAG: hypothetical protein RL591_30, partial [Planctomycetota bacterium]
EALVSESVSLFETFEMVRWVQYRREGANWTRVETLREPLVTPENGYANRTNAMYRPHRKDDIFAASRGRLGQNGPSHIELYRRTNEGTWAPCALLPASPQTAAYSAVIAGDELAVVSTGEQNPPEFAHGRITTYQLAFGDCGEGEQSPDSDGDGLADCIDPDDDGDGVDDASETDADFNNDGIVDGADLGILLKSWGDSGMTDLDGDGTTGGRDLAMLLAMM